MNIPSSKYLKTKARKRLDAGQNPQQVVLVYAGISALMAFLVTAVRYALSMQISQTGGLQNIGMRSLLSTADNVLPILQAVVVMCLDLGYMAAMLRIGRRQYASAKTLKVGMERFWPLLISRLLIALMYFAMGLILSNLAAILYTMSPFSARLTELMMPLLSDEGAVNMQALLSDDALMNTLYDAAMPALIIWMVLYIPSLFLFSYRYRFVNYVLADQPQAGAMAAIRQSRILMRGNTWKMIRVDLSFWWYYLLKALAMVLLYADLILALFGIVLPVSQTVLFLGTAFVYLAADFAINYFLRNHVEVTYALAYSSLVPREQTGGVVLGNIFQMAQQGEEEDYE